MIAEKTAGIIDFTMPLDQNSSRANSEKTNKYELPARQMKDI